ncbi:MAG: ATP-binding cassette domain-containing protein [Thiohalocapsa sp. PB-PSB1]|jgi:ATPase subunit of ABC transporter with duplicated ATPase domains|nr:MAG: hypothetical protein N838_17125 [Thiohalocapsa sp. PB-PSB1]QQO52143.1 MAG: ATP-binding cassette domain-containing protein [Thiohalocapsa sp. PB-PSB1]HCS92587.1 ABC transporter [Chromatiaceae bacterium]
MRSHLRAEPPEARTLLLQVDGLIAGWNKPVVGPVSFALSAGEVVGLWGANGSGKSTLLAALAGGAHCFAGSLCYAPGLRLAVQPQAPVRFTPLPVTGREFLSIAGANPDANAGSMPQSLVRLLPQRLDLLSGGQHQLLGVWAALAGPGQLVLLDEPTNNLDPIHAELLAQMLMDRATNRAVLMVSHEQAFLDANCSRVLQLASGPDRNGALATFQVTDGPNHTH